MKGDTVVRGSEVNYYVSPAVEDGDGTLFSPWNSISEHVGVLIPGDTLFLRGGLYQENQTIRVSASGLPDAPITLATYQGEPAEVRTPDTVCIARLDGSYVVLDGMFLNKAGTRGECARIVGDNCSMFCARRLW